MHRYKWKEKSMWRVWWCKNDWALFTIFQARTSARTYRQGSLNLQGFWIYIFVFELVKHFTFAFLDFQQELLYASNLKRYLFFGHFECWFFLLSEVYVSVTSGNKDNVSSYSYLSFFLSLNDNYHACSLLFRNKGKANITGDWFTTTLEF